MAALILPSRWTRQPSGPAGINQSNGLASGLITAWEPWAGHYDAALGQILPLTGTDSQQGVGLGGICRQWTGSSSATYYTPANITSGAISIVSVIQWTYADYSDIYFGGETVAGKGQLFRINNDGTTHYVIPTLLDVAGDSINGALSLGQLATVGLGLSGISNPHSYYFYRDGRIGTTGSTANSITGRSVSAIGSAQYAAYQGRKNLFLVLAWNRLLSDAEFVEATRNPWQLFQPLNRRIYFGAAASSGTTVTPSSGSLVLTGNAPTVTVPATTISAGVGSLTITGNSPTVSTPVTATPGVGSLVLTGNAPTVTVPNTTVAAGVGSLVITGYAPTITVPQAGVVYPDVGILTLTGNAPTITVPGVVVTPGVGSLTLTGNAPTISTPVTVNAGVGALTLTGNAPTIISPLSITPDPAQIILTGWAPTIVGGIGVSSQGVVPAGGVAGRKRRYRKPIIVEIDNQTFVVASESEAEALIQQVHEAAEVAAKAEAERILVKRRTKAKVKKREIDTSPVWIDTPKVTGPDTDLARILIERIQADLKTVYEQAARDAEIALLAHHQRLVDDDEAIAVLLSHF